MNSLKRRLIAACVVLCALSGVAYAQFGIPQLVFDPTAAAKIIAQTSQLLQEYQLLMRAYQTAESTRLAIENNAKMIVSKDGWRYAAAPLMYPTSSNAYGTSGQWMNTLNRGIGATQAYEMATVRMSSPSGVVSAMSAAERNRFAQHTATLELNDGVAANAMSVTGSARNNLAAQQAALTKLQNDSLSNDPLMNTEVGVLNKLNAGVVINAHAAQGTNQMLAVIADQNTISQKERHDLIVDEINNSIAAQAAKAQNTQSIWGGHTTAARSFRLP